MKNEKMRTIHNLVMAFTDIPFEGLELELNSLNFKDLGSPAEALSDEHYPNPIMIRGSLTPVGSKLDVRGTFSTQMNCSCDRCMVDYQQPTQGDFSAFLMPKDQFSAHDKPGGKVIHGPTRNVKPSRHHSRSKAKELSDAEGEHEDVSFGAFDGETVDLRPLIREQMILQIPMKSLCTPQCKGLCLVCGENVNLNRCKCAKGPTLIEADEKAAEAVEEPTKLSPLAQALSQKLKSGQL